jgi:hypothetical protein
MAYGIRIPINNLYYGLPSNHPTISPSTCSLTWLSHRVTGVSGTAVVSGSTGTTFLEIGPDNLATFVPDVGPVLSAFTAGTVNYQLCFAGVTLAGAQECSDLVDFTVLSNPASPQNVGICSVDDTDDPCDDPAQEAGALRVHWDKIDWGEETDSFYYIVELSAGAI